MEKKSIDGYARACRLLFDALDGHMEPEKLVLMYDECQEKPIVGMAKMHKRALQMHLMTKPLRQRIGAALAEVENDGTEGDALTKEEQAEFILAWYKGAHQGTYTVSEAAKILGYSRNNVALLIREGKLEATRPEGKPHAAWTIDGTSLAAFAKRRGIEIE